MGHKGDRHKYPAGKKRFEPLGVLIFSVTMIASFVQVSADGMATVLTPVKSLCMAGLYRVFPKGIGSTEGRRRSGRTQLAWYRVSNPYLESITETNGQHCSSTMIATIIIKGIMWVLITMG